MSGFFVTFEGGEGSGKTTQINLLRKALDTYPIPTLYTREPGGTPLGQSIRELLLGTEMTPHAELLLFNASRRHLVDTVIRPALDEGRLVICDRFTNSTIAYQHDGRGIPLPAVLQANALGCGGLVPDLTFYLDIDPRVGLERKTVAEVNRMESAGIEFHQRVRRGYLKLSSLGISDRWVVLDASADPQELHSTILRTIFERIALV